MIQPDQALRLKVLNQIDNVLNSRDYHGETKVQLVSELRRLLPDQGGLAAVPAPALIQITPDRAINPRCIQHVQQTGTIVRFTFLEGGLDVNDKDGKIWQRILEVCHLAVVFSAGEGMLAAPGEGPPHGQPSSS